MIIGNRLMFMSEHAAKEFEQKARKVIDMSKHNIKFVTT